MKIRINLVLILILLLVSIGLKGRSQANAQYVKGSTAVGSKVVRYPDLTVSNSVGNLNVEKSLLPTPDTIYASSMTVGSRFYGEILLNVTTPALSIGSVTIKFKAGPALATGTLSLTNGLSLNAGSTGIPIKLIWDMEVKSMSTQLFNAHIEQDNGMVIPITLTNMNPQANWTLDMTQLNLFDATLTFTGVTLGTTSYVTKKYRRYIEQ